jgi:hypothetical protein
LELVDFLGKSVVHPTIEGNNHTEEFHDDTH